MKTIGQIQDQIADNGPTHDLETAYRRAALKAIINGDTFEQEPKRKRRRRRGRLPTSPLKIELRNEVHDRQNGLCFDCGERLWRKVYPRPPDSATHGRIGLFPQSSCVAS